MLIMVAGVTVFAEGLAGNVQKARAVSSEGPNTDTFEEDWVLCETPCVGQGIRPAPKLTLNPEP